MNSFETTKLNVMATSEGLLETTSVLHDTFQPPSEHEQAVTRQNQQGPRARRRFEQFSEEVKHQQEVEQQKIEDIRSERVFSSTYRDFFGENKEEDETEEGKTDPKLNDPITFYSFNKQHGLHNDKETSSTLGRSTDFSKWTENVL